MSVNRVRELAFLQRRYDSGQVESAVLFGRSRVGKTELLRRFCQDKRCFFFVADLGTEASALAELARRYGEMFHGDSESTHFATWEQTIKALARQATSAHLIVVLDEFTYLLQTGPTLPSLVQRLWDKLLQPTDLMLILSGSYIDVMEREVLAYQAPLYGRRIGQLRLQPLSFGDAHLFLPGYSPQDQVQAYAVLGGVPAYLRQFNDRHPLLNNIKGEILLASRRWLNSSARPSAFQESASKCWRSSRAAVSPSRCWPKRQVRVYCRSTWTTSSA